MRRKKECGNLTDYYTNDNHATPVRAKLSHSRKRDFQPHLRVSAYGFDAVSIQSQPSSSRISVARRKHEISLQDGKQQGQQDHEKGGGVQNTFSGRFGKETRSCGLFVTFSFGKRVMSALQVAWVISFNY